MRKTVFFLLVLFLLLIISPIVDALIEEDWINYTRIDETNRDESGTDITLSLLKKSYTSPDGTYTVTVKDFDAQGTVVLDVKFMGKQETVILRGEWDANGTKIILTPPVEIFDKMMIITPKKIVPPAGIFTCCPEAEINIDLIRPELFIELKEHTTSITYEYVAVDPFANWSNGSKIGPFNESVESVSGTISDKSNAYRINEPIFVGFEVSNRGDAESQDNAVYIDTDGLIIEDGMSYYQLPSLAGEKQKTSTEPTSINKTIKLRFPSQPQKLVYKIHAYVKGARDGIIYYYDSVMDVSLLPSIKLQKSATKEIMLPSRQDVERLYHSIDATEIYRWLQGGDIYVSIGVTSYQDYEIKGIKLVDTAGRQFRVENQTLNWTFDLKPYEVKEFKYKVKALRTGNLKHPPAQLTYFDLNRTWSLTSATPSTEVHGDCVQVYKKPENPFAEPGGNATIIVTIRNSGDMPSRINITDVLPENSSFFNGTMYYKGIISPNDAVVFSYIITINSTGKVQLPGPKMYVNDREYEGCGPPILGTITINETIPPPSAGIVNITLPAETPVTIPTPPQENYGFLEGLIPALMLILSVAVLIMLHRTNK